MPNDEERNIWARDEQAEAWFQGRFGEADVWLIAAGKGGRYWADFVKESVASIGWDQIGDIRKYTRKEDVQKGLSEHGFGENPFNDSLALWEFAHEVQIGDILIAKKGRKTILGWGKVTGDYVHDPSRPEFPNIRKVEWYRCQQPMDLPDDWRFHIKTLTRFSSYKLWIQSIFERIEGKIDAQNESVIAAYGIDSALKDVFVDDLQFKRILDSLANHKNLILQGSPGVGKTFIAHRIAWCLIGRKDLHPVETVQFHQSYAYEDFVQGWRPTESGGFTMRNGVFFEFCKRAEKEPDTQFVFIIDEINRGNLSRIFGELLMLIEADKRKSDFALRLTYTHGSERFFVPANVHILGLMNTADRSLAMVDYALRRRFAFETLEPAYHTGKFREYLMDVGVDPSLIDRIAKEMSEINQRIREDKDLGPGFQIGHSYFVPSDTTDTTDEVWFHTIVDTQIEPLLREYWFDRPAHVDELLTALKR